MTERSFVDNPFKLKYLPHSSDKMFRVGDVLRYKDGDDNTLGTPLAPQECTPRLCVEC
jgi:hypothetical protein